MHVNETFHKLRALFSRILVQHRCRFKFWVQGAHVVAGNSLHRTEQNTNHRTQVLSKPYFLELFMVDSRLEIAYMCHLSVLD